MNIKGFLEKINQLICNYIGLEKENIQPQTIEIKNNKLMITNTVTFKRHLIRESWNNFNNSSLTQTNKEIQEKLGRAIGKAIAQKLVVSFEETNIEKN